MKKRFLFIILFVCLFVAAAGVFFWPSSFEGTFSQSGGDEEFAWYTNTTYRFHRYHKVGYPPVSESGWYWVTAHEGNTYTVKVWVNGDAEQPNHIEQHIIELTDETHVLLNGSPAQR